MNLLNKKANYTYKLEPERVEAGLSLTGGEAKAVRTGHADLNQAVARIVDGEAFLINANIPVSGAKNYNSTRTRKLLLHKQELVSLGTKMKQFKLTLVPIKLYTRGHLIKLQLALGKAKRKFEKREQVKRKDIAREIERDFRLK